MVVEEERLRLPVKKRFSSGDLLSLRFFSQHLSAAGSRLWQLRSDRKCDLPGFSMPVCQSFISDFRDAAMHIQTEFPHTVSGENNLCEETIPPARILLQKCRTRSGDATLRELDDWSRMPCACARECPLHVPLSVHINISFV